jgi:hypothetical protein
MSCEKHKRIIEKYNGTLKELANDIGDLHYQELVTLFNDISIKLFFDGEKDKAAGRIKLGDALNLTSKKMLATAKKMKKVWDISKPYMDNILIDWVGHVLEIKEGFFIAKVNDGTGTDEILEYEGDKLSPDELEYLELGACFHMRLIERPKQEAVIEIEFMKETIVYDSFPIYQS